MNPNCQIKKFNKKDSFLLYRNLLRFIAYTLLLEVKKMAYSDRELIARIVQCEARRGSVKQSMKKQNMKTLSKKCKIVH